MADITAAVAELLQGLLAIILEFYLPSSGTLNAINIIIWFGTLFGAIIAVVGLIRRMVGGGRR